MNRIAWQRDCIGLMQRYLITDAERRDVAKIEDVINNAKIEDVVNNLNNKNWNKK